MKIAIFLYNPRSGRGSAGAPAESVCNIFRANGYHITPHQIDFNTNPFDGNEQIDLMVVAGGDGTVNFVVNSMKNKGLDIALGVIPAGTANDFARALGMAKNSLSAARQIAQGTEEHIDCGRVNGLYYVNVFSFGLFTTTSQHTPDKHKHRVGKLAYFTEGIKEFTSMHVIPLTIIADGHKYEYRTLMTLIFNGETAGGIRLARTSSVRDGVLDCILLEKKGVIRTGWAMFLYLLRGRTSLVHHIQARKLEITSPVDEPTDVDGQKGASFPLHIECLAGDLRVICPKKRG